MAVLMNWAAHLADGQKVIHRLGIAVPTGKASGVRRY
jgi:hypothetical protein